MKAGKVIFWSVFGFIVLGGGYFAYSKMKSSSDAKKKADQDALDAKAALAKDPNNATKKAVAQQTAATAALTKTVASGFPLQRGSTGDLVKNIQRVLNTSPLLTTKLSVDGIFGNLTQGALMQLGYPSVVNEVTYNNMVSSVTPLGISTVATPTDVAPIAPIGGYGT